MRWHLGYRYGGSARGKRSDVRGVGMSHGVVTADIASGSVPHDESIVGQIGEESGSAIKYRAVRVIDSGTVTHIPLVWIQ